MCEQIKILSLVQICACLADPLRLDPQCTKQGSRPWQKTLGRKVMERKWFEESIFFLHKTRQEAFLVWNCSRKNIQPPVRRQKAVKQLSGHVVDLSVLPELALVIGPEQWCHSMYGRTDSDPDSCFWASFSYGLGYFQLLNTYPPVISPSSTATMTGIYYVCFPSSDQDMQSAAWL